MTPAEFVSLANRVLTSYAADRNPDDGPIEADALRAAHAEGPQAVARYYRETLGYMLADHFPADAPGGAAWAQEVHRLLVDE